MPEAVEVRIKPAGYYARALDVEFLYQWEARALAGVEADALAAGCAHEVTQVGAACTQLVPDPRLAAAHRGAITGLGRAGRAVGDGVRALALTGSVAATDDEQLLAAPSRRVPPVGGDL